MSIFTQSPRFTAHLSIGVLLCFGLVACGDNNDTIDEVENNDTIDAPEIAGVWASNFGSVDTITGTTFGSSSTIVAVDNDANWMVTKNNADAEFSPNTYSKLLWTAPESGEFYYCTVTFGEETLEAARDTSKMADEAALDTDGCGGFSWTKLTDKDQAIATFGKWDTSFGDMAGGAETVTTEKWAVMDLRAFDNSERWAVTQNPADSEFDPSKYIRIIWTPIDSGVFHYCMVAYSLETEQEALDSEETADATALDTDGCGGFPWTKMTAQ